LDSGFLCCIEQAVLAELAPADSVVQRLGAALLVAFSDVEDARAAQAYDLGDLVVGAPGLAQSHDLKPSLMPGLSAQRSHVGCLHGIKLRAALKTSRWQGPDQYRARLRARPC